MMQLLCDGHYVDLLSDTDFGFQKVNPLFAFDDLSVERSQSFNIPATPHNNALFSMAKSANFDGVFMRSKHEAELQVGAVVKRGFLYITEYSSGYYSAVFVTGELFELKKAAEAGPMWSYSDKGVAIKWEHDGIRAEEAQDDDLIKVVKYKSNVQNLPSWNLRNAINDALAFGAFGFTINYPPQVLKPWIIPSKVAGVRAQNGRYYSAGLPISIRDLSEANELDVERFLGSDSALLVDEEQVQLGYKYNGTNNYYFYDAYQYVAKQELIITFPRDLSDDVFLCTLPSAQYVGDYSIEQPTAFFGDYSFVAHAFPNEETRYDITGEPLAGRAVTIPLGARFILMNKNAYQYYYRIFQAQSINTQGYDFAAFPLDFNIGIKVEGRAQIGSIVRYVDQLPDWTIIDACKYLAAMTGTMLDYDANTRVLSFLDLSEIHSWTIVNLDGKVIASSAAVSRVFYDYARRNVVRFEGNEYLDTIDHLEQVYTLDNEYLSNAKELQVIPLSEGRISDAGVYIEGKDKDGSVSTGKVPTVGMAGLGAGEYMKRVELIRNERLADMVKSSTKVELRALISLHDFDLLKGRARVYYDGALYVWTECSWSNGEVRLVLQKIG